MAKSPTAAMAGAVTPKHVEKEAIDARRALEEPAGPCDGFYLSVAKWVLRQAGRSRLLP